MSRGTAYLLRTKPALWRGSKAPTVSRARHVIGHRGLRDGKVAKDSAMLKRAELWLRERAIAAIRWLRARLRRPPGVALKSEPFWVAWR